MAASFSFLYVFNLHITNSLLLSNISYKMLWGKFNSVSLFGSYIFILENKIKRAKISFSVFIEQFYVKLSVLSIQIDLKSCHMRDFSKCICSFQVHIKWFPRNHCSLENGKFVLKLILLFSTVFFLLYFPKCLCVYLLS